MTYCDVQCSPLLLAPQSCSHVSVSSVLDWHCSGLETELQQPLSHRINSTACQWSEKLLPADCVWLIWCRRLSGNMECIFISPVRDYFLLKTWHGGISVAGLQETFYISFSMYITAKFHYFNRCPHLRVCVSLHVRLLWFSGCFVSGLYVGMSVCLCSLDSPLAQSVFIEQPPQIPTMAKLACTDTQQYVFQSSFSVTA